MRCEESEPLYQFTFKRDGNFNVYGKQRVGRPRGHWAEFTMEMAMNKHHNMDFERDDINHHLLLFCLAIDRII